MSTQRRKRLRPRQRPERASKVVPYDPDLAIKHFKEQLFFTFAKFDWLNDYLAYNAIMKSKD